jgi:hypothetical protein
MNNIINVNGIIMVLSCEKYIESRVCKNFINNNINQWVNNWQVVIVKGDNTIKEDYIYDKDNILTLKTEDTYIYLLKKRIKAIKILQNIYNIKEGILCCGDDVQFNRTILEYYLNQEKGDYEGNGNASYNSSNRNFLKSTVNDLYMYNYHILHPNENKEISRDYFIKICKRPNTPGAGGHCFYISNKSCNILVKHMENINWNIFYKDEITDSYPYTIEDAAISFILYFHYINYTCKKFFSIHNKKEFNKNEYLCYNDDTTWYSNYPNLKWRL